MFVFTLSHLLFWMRGVRQRTTVDRVYNDNFHDHDGGIPSGPSGSGVFPVSLLLTVTVTVVVAVKIAFFVPKKLGDE